ncbi:MAG TPA: hypothetical protein VFS77_11370 [Pyrinomonadaceae bacterium]|nr:hypothetical protein [Pyrinomonadaceae bacterium]
MEQMNITTNDSALETVPHAGVGLSPATWAVAGTLAKWTGEKIGGAIVGNIAGKLFDEALKLIGLGGPDLVAKLDKISDQLVEVQRSLDRLTTMTAEILKQLTELKEFMEKSLKIEALLTAMNRIEVAYGSASGEALLSEAPTGRAISLRLFLEKMPHFEGITAKQLQDASKDFAAYVTDMPDQIETIHRILAKAAFGQISLLTHWARELGRQVNEKKIDFEQAYLVLEGYFLQAIAIQLKGVSVHCTALAVDPLGPQFIKEFLEDNFAKTMADETRSFVEAVELLVFSTLSPTMQAGNIQDGMGEREFPKYVDEILIRADLISAAMNLVSHKPDASGKPSPSIQAAVQGIYGRTLVRPSDLNNGTPPSVAPAGYSAVAATDVRQLPFPCLDLMMSDGRATLRDAGASNVTVGHYYWKFNSPEPAEGKPIDPSRRGGVTPRRYPVFGPNEPMVLAASLFDVSRLYRGLPNGTAHSYKYTKFPGGDPDLGYYDERCSQHHHPLTNDSGDSFDTFFTVVNIWRLDRRDQHSYVNHALFKYSGPTIKVRLSANVASIIHRAPRKDGQGGTAFAQTWDVFNRLRLKHPDGSQKEFYNSVDSFGNEKPLSVNGSEAYSAWHQQYDKRRDGVFYIDFDLVPGDYEIVLDSEAAFWRAPKRYEGWQSTSLEFFLHGLAIERR